MSSGKEFEKVLFVNGVTYARLPKDFCLKHGIRKGDFIEREIGPDDIRFKPLEVD